ncbi:hypothetical protein [Piscinibacter sakaiensis]|uniref:hypothetical protein n=1 Tax=Piscinibacter sakaiensis TaxID=1547922 RepID=UPI003AAB4170
MNITPELPGRGATKLLSRWLRSCCASAIFVVVPLQAAPLTAVEPASTQRIESLTVAELKRDYLMCNRAVLQGRTDTPLIQQCSIIYEQLKQRAFGGDYGRLYVWSQQNPVRQTSH